MGHGDERSLDATACGQAAELCAQVGVLSPSGCLGRFDQRGAQPRITLPRPTRPLLASTLVIAWAESDPGRQMRCGRKAPHVWSDLGQDDLDDARPNARDRIQPFENL